MTELEAYVERDIVYTSREIGRHLPYWLVKQGIVDDLAQTARLAMLRAVPTFDETRAKPMTFLKFRIRGSMLDELRKLDTVSRYNRSLIRSGKMANPGKPVPIDTLKDHKTMSVTYDSDQGILRADLERLIKKLPPREAYCVTLYFLEEICQEEIAKLMGLGESRISQLVSSGLARLRRLLEGKNA